MCATNIATAWAVGGDEVSKERSRTAKYFKKKTISCQIVEFPEIAGYPIGGDFPIKYYMIQMHYDNPNLMSSKNLQSD